MKIDSLLNNLIEISLEAGKEILDIYNTTYEVEYKDDKSPLTLADKKSHEIIINNLKKLSNYPILSEEGKNIPYEERKNWEYFWLIDPLDGTKEFIKKNGEFTVNIALVHKGKPVLGIVFAPVKDILYYGSKELGAFKIENNRILNLNNINIEKSHKEITVVASKSHLNDKTKAFIENLKNQYSNINLVSIGSSLKICLVAEKKADIYPRLAPTMEWDTAAAHAILSIVGGELVKYEKYSTPKNLKELKELEYNKENLLNPNFIAFNPDVF